MSLLIFEIYIYIYEIISAHAMKFNLYCDIIIVIIGIVINITIY